MVFESGSSLLHISIEIIRTMMFYRDTQFLFVDGRDDKTMSRSKAVGGKGGGRALGGGDKGRGRRWRLENLPGMEKMSER